MRRLYAPPITCLPPRNNGNAYFFPFFSLLVPANVSTFLYFTRYDETTIVHSLSLSRLFLRFLEKYIFLRLDSIGGNRGDGLIEDKTLEEGTRGSLTSCAPSLLIALPRERR